MITNTDFSRNYWCMVFEPKHLVFIGNSMRYEDRRYNIYCTLVYDCVNTMYKYIPFDSAMYEIWIKHSAINCWLGRY